MNKGRVIAPGDKGFLKRIHDSAWAWDIFQGPVYNRLILKAASDYFDALIRLAGQGAPARILDVGCGAGMVSLRLAQAHPDAVVVGIDYALMQVRAAQRLKKKEADSQLFIPAGKCHDSALCRGVLR
jgi:ubiquinone/menaquinone biosynthesis C-methylase UbiE